MLLEFSIGNYRSFNSIQTLDFRSTGLVSEDKIIDQNNIIEISGNKILKTIGLYGPNGSGKSNLIKGLEMFCQLVKNSLESETIMTFAGEPFELTSEKSEHAGFFQIQLLLNQKKFRYGFTLSTDGSVLQEWLFGPADKNETWYFKRTHNNIETNKEWFEEGLSAPISNLRSNTLFLTFISAYNGQTAQLLRSFIANNILFEKLEKPPFFPVLITDFEGKRKMTRITESYRTNQLVKDGKVELVLKWLKSAGLVYSGIDLVESENSGYEKTLLKKNIFDKEGQVTGTIGLDLDENESAGTKKFYNYIALLFEKFSQGGVLISDEIDNNFHPSLLQQFIRFFNDLSINTAGAQLLFTSHDTNLLQPEILRRDQIYFCEKTVKDETILYSLADLKGIRNNADFARQYLAGFYGALPMLEKFKDSSTDLTQK